MMSSRNPEGNATATDYSALGNELAVTDPLGNKTSYNYDELGDQAAAVRPEGNATATPNPSYTDTSTYDLAGRLTQTEQGGTASQASTYSYDPDGNLVQVSAPGAADAPPPASTQPQVTQYAYNGRDLLWKTTTGSTPTGTHSDVRTTITETDGDGNVIRTVNPAGVAPNGTYIPYDGSYTASSDGDDSQGLANIDASIRVYDQNNQLLSLYLPWGCNLPQASQPNTCTISQVQDSRQWRIDYGRTTDGMDRLASVTQAYQWQNGTGSQTATTYTYMPNGWLMSEQTPQLGDNTNTPSQQDNGTQVNTTYAYDPAGDQIAEMVHGTGPSRTLNRSSTRSWWPDGRPQEEIAKGDENAARIAIDGWTQTGQLQQVQSQAVNSGGTLPGSAQENLCYDSAGRLTTTDQEVTNPTSTQFDTVFSYDRDGNVLARSDNGQLGTVPGTFSSCPSVGQAASLPVSGYSSGQTSTFVFDNLDRETSMSVASNPGDNPQQPTRSFTTSYWPSGAKKSQTRSQQGGTPITESWYFNDDGQEAEDVRSSDNTDQTFTYDTDGNRYSTENGTHTYNALDQEVLWTRGGPNTAGSGSLVSSPGTVAYTHDGDGALLQQTSTTNYVNVPVAGASVNESVQTTTRYCSQTSASQTSGLTAVQAAAAPMCTQDDGRVENTQTTSTLTGTVTLLGITTSLSIAPTTTTQLDCYDTLNELIEVVQFPDTCVTGSPSAAHTSQYGYNDYGEVASQNVPYPSTLSPNRTLTDSYAYDALGRRDAKSENLSGQPPASSTLGYIGLSTTALGWEQGTTANNPTSTGSYDYNSSGQPVGFFTTSTGNYYSYATDANGTVTGLENSAGNIATLDQYHYTPYGEPELGVNQTPNPLGSDTTTSKLAPEAQANTILFEGFQYNPAGSPDPAALGVLGNLITPSLPNADSYTLPARNYLPGQAMYQSPDNFEAASAAQALEITPAAQNPYAYAAGNPTTLIETDGHLAVCEPVAGSAAGECGKQRLFAYAALPASYASGGATQLAAEANTIFATNATDQAQTILSILHANVAAAVRGLNSTAAEAAALNVATNIGIWFCSPLAQGCVPEIQRLASQQAQPPTAHAEPSILDTVLNGVLAVGSDITCVVGSEVPLVDETVCKVAEQADKTAITDLTGDLAAEGGTAVFRTARLGRGASELEHGLRPEDFSVGDKSAYVGDEAAARTLANPQVGGYENFYTKFEMASPFESEFAPFRFPYPEGGPNSFEYQIPQEMIGRFNELTIRRTGVPYAP